MTGGKARPSVHQTGAPAAEATVSKVGVVGAGTMGFGIAIVAARGDYQTVVYDTDGGRIERLKQDAVTFIEKSIKLQKLTSAEAARCLDRLSATSELGMLSDCDLVIEAVFESFDVKSNVLTQLNKICRPDAIFASNTSTLSITQLAAASGRAANFVGLHFCLPAQIMKLVEVTPGMQTSTVAFDAAWAFCIKSGQIPIRTKDTPGFILNYFVIPFNNAAIRLVEQGVAEPPDIDTAVKTGLGHALGPLELVDMVGLDTQVLLCEAFYQATLDARMAAPHLLRQMVAANRLGRKSGRGFYDYASSRAFGA